MGQDDPRSDARLRPVEDPGRSLTKYLAEKDDLHAGKKKTRETSRGAHRQAS